MNGAYLSPNVKDKPGIFDKVLCQVKILETNGLETDLYMDSSDSKLSKIIPFFSKGFDKENIDQILQKNYNYLYIRKPSYLTFGFKGFLKKIKKKNKNTKIILEIPTYPYQNEYKHKIILFFPILIDKIVSILLTSYIDRIVTFSKDEKIFKIPTLNIENGYDFNDVFREKQNFEANKHKINIVTVANIENWHGIDRLLIGLSTYKKNVYDIHLDIIGDGNIKVIEELKKLISQNNLNNNVKLVGKKTGNELKKYLLNADIAIDSLGRHRSGVYYNSSLKGKQYLAHGLPIVSGVETELDNILAFNEFYLRVPADDTPVNFNSVIKFYNKIYGENNTLEIKKKIFQLGKNYFDYNMTMLPIINYLKGF